MYHKLSGRNIFQTSLICRVECCFLLDGEQLVWECSVDCRRMSDGSCSAELSLSPASLYTSTLALVPCFCIAYTEYIKYTDLISSVPCAFALYFQPTGDIFCKNFQSAISSSFSQLACLHLSS